MDTYTCEFIDGVVSRITEQSNEEKYKAILPFAQILGLKLSHDFLKFPDNINIWLDKIHGTATIGDAIFILLKNSILHILYKEGKHDVIFTTVEVEPCEQLKIGFTHLYDESLN